MSPRISIGTPRLPMLLAGAALATAVLTALLLLGTGIVLSNDDEDTQTQITIYPGDDTMLLSWPYSNEETLNGYLVQRKAPLSDEWTTLDIIPKYSTRYLDTAIDTNADGGYKYRVTQLHNEQITDRTKVDPDSELPLTPPTNLRAEVLKEGKEITGVRLSFDLAEVGGIQVTGYHIRRNGENLKSYFHPNNVTPKPVFEGRAYYTDQTATTQGTTYTYAIAMYAGRDHYYDDYRSPDSQGVSVTIPVLSKPEEPTGVTAALSSGDVSLTWDDPQDSSITGYKITRRTGDADPVTLTESTGSAGTSYTDTSAAAGATHIYRIKAINSVGSSTRSPVLEIDIPESPQLATTQSVGAINLSWTAPAGATITGYELTKTEDDQTDTWSLDATATSRQDRQIEADTTYTYTVAALTEDGSGPPSASLQVALPAQPPIPTGLQATSDGTQVTLTWDDPEDQSITGYRILRRLPNEGERSMLVIVSDTGNAQNTWTDSDITPGTQHVYRVKALRGAILGRSSAFVRLNP